jgi:AAA15 family ATPase/GTPase
MSKQALKKLVIEYLRGSILPFALPFEKGKSLTVIYGENGSGKSTICDSLEFLSKGQVGSLENRGLGRTSRFWHSVGKKPKDISVTLETTKGTWKANIGKSDVVVIPSTNRPNVEILRRNQILSLIQSDPANRYKAISRFIDVSSIESSENALRETIRNNISNREIALARVQENRDALEQFWEEAGKKGNNALTWAKEQVNIDCSSYDTENAAIRELVSAYERLSGFPRQLETAKVNLEKSTQAEQLAKSNLDKALSTATSDASEAISLLQAANRYLQLHPDLKECPVCNSAEKISGLNDRIANKIASFSSVGNAQNDFNTNQQAVGRARQQIELIKQAALTAATSYIETIKKYTWPTDVSIPKNPIPDELEKWPTWLESTTDSTKNWLQAQTTRNGRKQFINTLKKAYKTCVENTTTAAELNALTPKLEKTLQIIEEERHKFTKGILARIAAEVGRLYETVHPGEGLNKISLFLDPNKRASLEIGTDFYGQADSPPQAYFSDSHLDTLGLCVFLALAAMGNPNETILVLDDILGSVDEPHVERLIDMLYDETTKFRHCLITTHYRPWKHKLRWGWLKNGQCQFIELTKWTSTTGLSTVLSIPDIERLRILLAEKSPDPQLICSKAGVILEAALDFITLLYECSVPRRTGGLFTLGDLLPAIDKKLRSALKVEIKCGADGTGAFTYKTVPLCSHLDELSRIAQARNVFGCHFNQLSFDLLDSDAIGFGKQVLELTEAIIDIDAGWPRSCKSGSYWATSGETRRLYPLKKPF